MIDEADQEYWRDEVIADVLEISIVELQLRLQKGQTRETLIREAQSKIEKAALKPHQLDIFVADLLDAAPKDDTASMEHPLFALRAGDYSVRQYRRNGYSVTVKPGYDGCATIHDKDVWIYAISQLVEATNRGSTISRTVRFTAYDFLVTTHRQTSGRGYELMGNALARLAGTRIETNIKTGEQRERTGFGLIDSWRVIERDKNQRMVAVEITLPDWLYRAVQARQVLTLDKDYFRLRRPLERRIYELARKHCGRQAKWKVGIEALYEKSGSRASRREFRRAVKKMAHIDHLPGYRMRYEADRVTFYARSGSGGQAAFSDMLASFRA